jgi:hypothetical protein
MCGERWEGAVRDPVKEVRWSGGIAIWKRRVRCRAFVGQTLIFPSHTGGVLSPCRGAGMFPLRGLARFRRVSLYFKLDVAGMYCVGEDWCARSLPRVVAPPTMSGGRRADLAAHLAEGSHSYLNRWRELPRQSPWRCCFHRPAGQLVDQACCAPTRGYGCGRWDAAAHPGTKADDVKLATAGDDRDAYWHVAENCDSTNALAPA